MTRVPLPLIVLGFLCSSLVPAADVPLDHFYPQEAVLVPVAERSLLQSRLNQHGVIRLERGDYATGNTLSKLVVRDGNRIYGLGNSMPPIEIERGTSGAVLSAVHGQITFPASPTITAQNLFRRTSYSTISVNGGTLEDNLFLDTSFSRLSIDHTTGGYWSGNRIIRVLNHTATPMLTLRGTPTSRAASRGNVFVWMNSLGAYSEIMNLANQGDLSVVFIDCESYSNSGSNAMTVRDVDNLTIFGTYGSMRTGRTLDQGAASLWLHGHEMGTYSTPGVVQTADNATSVISHFPQNMGTPSNSGSNTNRFRLFNTTTTASKTLLANEANLATPLSGPQEDAFMGIISTTRTEPTWERPQFNPIPDPAGPSWNADLGSKPSSRAAIQSEIDSKGVAILGPGTYYLDGPLVMGRGEGLVGAGADRTVLIAKNSGIDLIVGDPAGGPTNLILTDLTLQGGRSGIRHTVSGAQFTDMTISHVTIRDMADSGIWLENIYAWDNNFFEAVNITRCPSGIKQRAPSGAVSDSSPTLTYLDKNVFYQCQITACGRALDLIGNRSSNGNTWVNCRFADNTQYVSAMRAHNTAIFVNCDFINNNGHPVVNVQGQLYMVACAFSDTTSGATDFVDGIGVSLEGCTFSRAGSSGVVITAGSPNWIDLSNPANNSDYRNHNSFFFNCHSTNVPLNLMFSGLVVNSSFPDRADLSVRAAIVTGQGLTVTTLVPGAVNTADVRSKLLIGSVFPPGLTAGVPSAVPTITSATSAIATVGSPFAYLITASNNATTFSASGLPAWLSLTPGSGLLSGTPPAIGSATFTIAATNFIGNSTPLSVTVTVNAPAVGAPVITSAATASGTVGQPFSYQIIATNSPVSYAVDPSTVLPSGLSLNTTTGLISGTPVQGGSSNHIISATNVTATTTAPLVIAIQLPASVPPASGSTDSGGGGSGCGFGATAASLFMLGFLTLLVRRFR
jgi:hypothetical protein